MFATMPNLMPALISNTLYRFDVSIRSASIQFSWCWWYWLSINHCLAIPSMNRVGVILVGIIVMVVVIDWISGWIRKKLV